MKSLRSADTSAMSDEQRGLVRENVGLVGVHLRRIVGVRSPAKRRQERDDLFQEGCLGLIRAARSYDPALGIPFRAYALARIRSSVHRALVAEGDVPRPARRAKADPFDNSPSRARRTSGDRRSRRDPRPVDEVWVDRRARPDPSDRPTVGDRMREKYERAVAYVAARLSKSVRGRGDRATLVQVLLRDRFLVPERTARRPIRNIALETGSSFGRVAAAERRIQALVCGQLESDPEFRLMRRLCRDTADGPDQVLDEQIERRLRDASEVAFLNQFRAADASRRGTLIASLLGDSEEDVATWIRARFQSLSAEARERMLLTALDDGVVLFNPALPPGGLPGLAQEPLGDGRTPGLR